MWAITALAVVGVTIFVERMLAVATLTRQLHALDARLRDAVEARGQDPGASRGLPSRSSTAVYL